MRSMLLGLAVCAGCLVEGDEQISTTTEFVLEGWMTAAYGSTSGDGVDLELPPGWTCFLTGVGGNLSEGNETESSYDFISSARVIGDHLDAHGGGYYDNGGQLLANNPVKARTACVPRPSGGTGTWYARRNTPSPPAFVAEPKPGRHCFLSEISGGGGRWANASDYARVVNVLGGSTNYPRAGWYVESNEIVTGTAGTDARVSAVCVDFPAGTGFASGDFHGYAFGPRTEWLTNGDAIKVCGLTTVQGAFTVDNYTNGVFINEPPVVRGQWNMVVSTGKYGKATCAW